MTKNNKATHKKSNRVLFITVGSLLLLAAAIVVWQVVASSMQKPASEQLTAYVVKPQEPLLLDGTVVSTQETQYTYELDKGEITTIHVTDGQEVVAGQALYEYHNKTLADELEDMYRQQTRLYNQREESRQQLQEQKNKRWTYVVNTRDQIGDQTAEVDTQAFDSTIQTMETTINEQTATIEDLEAKIVRAKENMDRVIVAEHDGVVSLDLTAKKNATIPFMKIKNHTTLIHAQISEYEYHLVAKDQPVTVYINAQDREIQATITSVASEPTSATSGLPTASGVTNTTNSKSNSSAQYAIKVTPSEQVQTGFTVQVRIPQSSVIVPEDAVVTLNGKEYVYLYQNGVAQQRAIKRVKQGFQQVVTEGLVVDDVVIVKPDETVVDGASVSVEVPQTEESMPQ